MSVLSFIETPIVLPSLDIVSKAISPTFVMLASLNDVVPNVLAAAVDVIPAAAVIPPPSAIVIASSPSVYSINGVLIAVSNELVPVDVIAPQPIVPIVAIFLLLSKTTALLAAAVPAVTLSRTPSSAVVIVVVSRVRLVSPVIVPVTSIPEAVTLNLSVSLM